MTFEWDEEKNLLNIQKHGISFQEALVIFTDDHLLEYYDSNHSSLDEDRYVAIGKMRDVLIAFVAYTERKDKIRIISARKATVKEEKTYYDHYYDA
jgi:uncharacterized DUF497 family protein